MSTISDIIAQLESSAGRLASRQPSGMFNPTYGQGAGFAKQYGSGAAGVDNYANQVIANTPDATLGQFYSSYVLGTGNPSVLHSPNTLQSVYPSAYQNLLQNAGVNMNTPLASLLGAGSGAGTPAQAGTTAAASTGSPASVTQDQSNSLLANIYLWLKQLFSINSAERTVAVVIGGVLALGAVIVLLNSSKTVQDIAATGTKIVRAGASMG